MIRYAKRRLEAAGCAIVAASREDPDTNGLMWMVGDQLPTDKDVRALKRGAEDGAPAKIEREPTAPRPLDVSFDYVAWLQERWIGVPAITRPIVIDAAHGAWACRARRYLQAIFPHSLFSAIHDTPGQPPGWPVSDCSRPESLQELADAVYQERAYLGIAFDGDGDRVAFVDDDGTPLTADETAWILLQTFGQDLAGKPFVHDVKFSDRVSQAAEKLGAEPLVERTGPHAVRTRMLKSGAPFGAESGGHYFFGDLGGEDDGLFAACRVIAHLVRSGKTLAKLRRKCPKIFVTPDLPVRVKARYRQQVVRQVRDLWSKYPQTEVDGVRIELPDGWVLVRNPASEPALLFRFESRDWKGLAKLVSKFCDRLPEVGEALWASYEDAMGLDYEES